MAQRTLFEEPTRTTTKGREEVGGTPRLREVRRGQMRMEVVDLETLLPEEHVARLVWAAVGRLNLTAFYEKVRARGGNAGRPATDPKLLLALWLYATIDGVGSARELERLCRDHVAYRWLCGGVTVNNHLLAAFRVGHEAALDELLSDVVGRLMAAGLVTLRRVATDGMKVRASAGAASFRRRPRLEQFVEDARAHVAQVKASVHDPTQRTRREAAQVRAAEDRQRRVEAALAAMPEAEKTKARQRTSKSKKPKEPRVSTTDPEARVMKMADGGFRPAYNLQFSTDVDSRFIVGADVSTLGNDFMLLTPALDDIERRTGDLPRAILVDGGYVNIDAFTDADARDVTVYAPVPKPRTEGADPYTRKPKDSDATAIWRRRMQTDDAKDLYKQRAATAETTNADLRLLRGLDRVLVRGRSKILCLTLWAAIAYNLLRAPLDALLA